MNTYRELMLDAQQRLQAAGVYSPEADAAIIISAVLNITREQLKERLDDAPLPDIRMQIEAAVKKREERVPIARIFGRTMFRGISINTGNGVFEPCIETETLIEHLHFALEKYSGPHHGELRILDIGTGTGCLLISALNEIPHSTGLGVDIGEQAVALAKENAHQAGVGSRVEFLLNNWVEGITQTFDVVLCNPPFIPTHLIPTLVPEVMVHDPKASLDGGDDGMMFYRRLPHDFYKVSNPGAVGMFHVSMTFAEQVRQMFHKAGYQHAELCRNHYGVPMGLLVLRDSYHKPVTLWNRVVNLLRIRRA